MVSLAKQRWLKKRKEGVGASDSPSVLGLSPWKSPYQLWCEKVGLVEEPNLDELERIEWGQVLEAPIAKKYSLVTGRRLINTGRLDIRKSPTNPILHCTIDREIPPTTSALVPTPENAGDLSIKNVGFFKMADWKEQPPLMYQVQIQHELFVTGLAWGSFAVLIGGQQFRWADVARNNYFISFLVEKVEEFWDSVLRGIPPPVDGSDNTRELLLRLYPKDSGEVKALPPAFEDSAKRRALLKEQAKQIEQEIQLIDNQIKSAIGTATVGVLPDGSGFSWKAYRKERYVVEAKEHRVLREIKPGKEQ